MYAFLILVDFSFKNFELNPNTSECGFPGGSVVKNMPVNTGDAGDSGLIPESGRSPGGGNSSPLNILAWEMPQTEEPGGLQSMGSPRVGHN